MRGMANNQSKIIISKTLLLLLTIVFCQNFVACQTKEQKATAAMQKCQQLLDKDEVLAAGDCYGTAIIANPESATEISKTGEEAFYKKCVELHDRENYKQAIICFDAVTTFKPDSANVYFLLADSYYQYNKVSDNGTTDLLDRAEEAIKQGLQLHPESAEFHSLYGDILNLKGELREALSEYKQAIKIKPKEILFWIQQAMIQEKLGNDSSAISSYYQVLQLEANQSIALYNSAKLYEKMGDRDKAIAAYEKLLQTQVNYDDAEQRLKLLKEDRAIIERHSKSKTGIGTSGKP